MFYFKFAMWLSHVIQSSQTRTQLVYAGFPTTVMITLSTAAKIEIFRFCVDFFGL